MTKFIKSSVNLQRTRISNFNNIFMKKPSLIILLVLLSCQLFGQTLKTTIDNSLLGQGNKGITALKVRNTLHSIVDSVRLSKSPSNIIQSSSYRFVTDAEKYSWNGKLDAGSYSGEYGIMVSQKIYPNPAPPDYLPTEPFWATQFVNGDDFYLQFSLGINQKENSIAEGTTSQFWRGDKTWQELSSLPVSTSTQTALNAKLSLSGGTMTGNLLLNTVVKAGGNSTFENTWLGQDVLNSVTSGTQNVGIGKNTLKAITGGSWNTGLGYKSLEFGTTSTKNSAVGAYSLNSTTTGQYNTAIGYEAGKLNTTGYYNTFLGGFTGVGYETSSGRIWISDGLGNVRISVTNTGKVGIGTMDATSPLQIIDLPVFSSNSSAISAGLTAGAVYRSSTGFLMIVY